MVAVVSGYMPTLRPALYALDFTIVLATAADCVICAGRRLEARRDVASILSVGRANAVSIVLNNRSRRTLVGLVNDDPLTETRTDGLPAVVTLLPLGATSLTYDLTPMRRGPRDLGAVTVRYGSPLGLVLRQERIALPAHVDVYPDVHAARALELLRRQGRQDARLGSLRVRGGDTEFERLRPYQRGDEVRHVDWRASARRDDPTVRQFQAESNQNVVFALDVGRSMRGESGGITSVDHALGCRKAITWIGSAPIVPTSTAHRGDER